VGGEFAAFETLEFESGGSGKRSPAIDTQDYTVLTYPSRHSLPTTALRIALKGANVTLAYSADTEPCPELVEAAEGVDLLIHEASVLDPTPGHSTPVQAASVAASAGAARLLLVHLPEVLLRKEEAVLGEAAKFFTGEISLASDGDVIPLSF
jgi:ribonuclease Z